MSAQPAEKSIHAEPDGRSRLRRSRIAFSIPSADQLNLHPASPSFSKKSTRIS